MDSLLTPEGGLLGLMAASFIAATLLPLSSEAVLFGYLKIYPEHAAIAVATATVANTAGGMTTYLMGRLVPARTQSRLNPRALAWLKRFGAPATLLAWLPVIGDALCLAAGWLRLNWMATLAFTAAGRLARYLAVSYAA